MEFQLLTYNLLILNSVIPGDKLSIINNRLYIDEVSLFRPFYRYFYSQNREKTHVFIINLINNMANELSKFYLLTTNKSKLNINNLNIKNLADYNYYLLEFKNIKNSLKNLSKSYENDKLFSRKLLLNCNLIDELDPEHRWN